MILPIKTVSTLNQREHWRARYRRSKSQREAARALSRCAAAAAGIPCVVTLTRIAPSNGLDGDNLQGALKAVRDGVADAIGVDDRDPSVEWRYGQERGKEYAVRIEIAGAAE